MNNLENLKQENKILFRHFNALMWVAFALTLLIAVGAIFSELFNELSTTTVLIPIFIIGLGIWTLLLWGYLPNIFSLTEYLRKKAYRIGAYEFPPVEEDAELINSLKIYKKINPLWNLIIAIFLFSFAYLMFLSLRFAEITNY